MPFSISSASTGVATPTTVGTVSGQTSIYTTSIGNSSLLNNTTGMQNAGFGSYSLISNTTGGNNTAAGMGSLYLNTTGSNNTALGTAAGYDLTTGSNNSIIGRNAQPSSATVSNEITMGDANITRFRIPALGIDWTSSALPATKVSAPATATSTGVTGQIATDASYIYVCTATNTWKRVAISTW